MSKMNPKPCPTDKAPSEPLLSPEQRRHWFCIGYFYALLSGARLVVSNDPAPPIWPRH
jgi:hypothetical protein